MTDTQLPGNSILVSKIQKEATGSSLVEAFLESAPQLILQLSIVLRTGIASEFFGVHPYIELPIYHRRS
jgi:hypothetical protein